MKKIAGLIIVVMLLSMTLVSNVSASSISLIGVDNVAGKGVKFTFDVDGFTKDQLTGFVLISGNEFPMDCNFKDDGKLVCVAGGGINQFIGQPGIVVLAGQGFNFGQIPPKRAPATVYCYDVWDYFSVTFPIGGSWYFLGENCQYSPAEAGDVIYLYSSASSTTNDFVFMHTPSCYAYPTPGLQDGEQYLPTWDCP